MRNLIFFMHISLDGFVAGTQGELNWVKIDEELFDFVAEMTAQADTALYGRVTYELMESYWPTAADKLNASKHDIEHSRWYKSVDKVVLSNTLSDTGIERTTVLNKDLTDHINAIKRREGKNILIFGSPGASLSLLQLGLIDEFWFFVNPIIKGTGIPMFKGVLATTKLELVETKTFSCGVVALHYRTLVG
jgi:dihydrofolate reductase